MYSDIHKTKDGLKSFGATFVFNTIIAIVLNYMVLKETRFIDVFIISQAIGLSICSFISIALHFVKEKNLKIIIAWIIAALIAGVFFGSMLSWIYMSYTQGVGFKYFLKDIFLYTFVLGILLGIVAIYFFTSWAIIQESEKKIQQEKIKRLTIEKEAADTTLRLLQAQIEPHFLFNTLSNIMSLLEVDIEKGKAMLMDLNDYLRISLMRTRENFITLEQELELVKRYLNIFKIRMGHRLDFQIIDHTGPVEIPFPPLIVQPIVENSIKYGIEPLVDGGNITIECFIEKDLLKINITDTGQGLDNDANKAGIGIDNVSKRLYNIYGSAGSLTLKENKPKRILAIIEVPYESKH